MTKRRYKKNRVSWRKTGDKLRDQYNAYRQAYQEQERKLNSRGLEMSKDIFSFETWKEKWMQKKNDLEYLANMGLRRGIGNVNQYLVRDQAYELSYKAGEAVYQGLKKRGELIEGISKSDYVIMLRQGRYLSVSGWWEGIREFREDLKKQGYDNEYIKRQISEVFYGSEK